MINGIAKLFQKKNDEDPFYYTCKIIGRQSGEWTDIHSITFTFPNRPRLYKEDNVQFTGNVHGGDPVYDS